MADLNCVCPECGKIGALSDFLQESVIKQALVLSFQVRPELGIYTSRYLALFKPQSGRSVRVEKIQRILSSYVSMMQAPSIKRHSVPVVIPVEVWRESLETILDKRDRSKLVLPLQDNNLLEEIAWRIARKRAEQPKKSHDGYHPSHMTEPLNSKQPAETKKSKNIAQIQGLKRLYEAASGSAKQALAEQIQQAEVCNA